MIFAAEPLPQDLLRQVGKGLAVGQKVRGDHDCGGPGTLLVSRNPQGLGGYCFRCGAKGFAPVFVPMAQRIAALAQARDADRDTRQQGLALPGPAVYEPREWPSYARVWLYKAGISDTRIKQAGFYYHARTDRVVMPLYEDGELRFYQARGFDPGRAKYLSPSVNREGLAYKVHRTQGPALVLTEDILSAVRVGDVAPAWSILGTRLPQPLSLQVAALDMPVIISLDPDAPGRAGAAQVQRQLAMMGVPCCIRIMDMDPKDHTRLEIQQWYTQSVKHFAT